MASRSVLALTASVVVSAVASTAVAESHLMRYADVHGDRVVFTYEGDLWLAPTAGGDARRITSDGGSEVLAKFSPDGSLIAFTANYDGGTDVYVMDARGGSPKRLTYHPAGDYVVDWYPDGKSILFRSRRVYPGRGEQIYRVSIDGGMPERLPVDRAGLTALSPDAKSIAYNRMSRESRTWKRHKGGTAQDIWLGSLEKGDFHRITDWPGSDNFPMWSGDAIYFNSDRKFGTLNIYKYDLKSKEVTALTDYRDYDVKYPSLGPGQIVYQYAESLHVLDLGSGETRKIEVNIPSDLVKMRPEYVSVTANTGVFGLSPSGTRMLLETRGEIVNLPVKKGEPINMTRTSDTREKNAAWSPDGRWVAFISDKTGEEEVYLVDQKGEQPWRRLTEGGKGWRWRLVWSPDSKWLVFSDKFMRLNLVDAETGGITVIGQGEYDDGWERWGIQDYAWSPDSQWIAYTKMVENLNESIFLYCVKDKETHRVTSDRTTDFSPSFDPGGRYLYFLSNRTFSPTMGFVDQNHVFLDMCRPYVVVLKEGEPEPFAPEDSEEEVKTEEENGETSKRQDEEGESGDEEDKAEPAEEKADEDEKGIEQPSIDVGDFERRTFFVEGVPAGNYFRLEATEKGFLYLKKDEHEFSKYQNINDDTGDKVDLYYYEIDEKDPEKRKPKKLLPGINNYHLSADGKKLAYRSGGKYGVVDAGKEAKVGDGGVNLDAVKIKIDREAEFQQIYNEAWRVQRDWFYDSRMHGVDWEAIGEKYRKFVPFCGNRSDLNYLIGEMIGELNSGHTYVWGGDVESEAKHVSSALLGVEFDTPAGAGFHRIAHIIPGTNWDPAERSPLWAPDCPIKEGDYLLAIDGEEITAADNVYKLLENKRGRVLALTYNSEPSAEGAKTWRARTIDSENAIRYREWVENNRAAVDKATDGRVGYVHIPDMGQGGLIEFAKTWYADHTKQGMVVDVRYNGGGFTGDMIIDRIERKLWAITQPREGKTIRDPERAFYGHIVVLMNEDTGSCGEYFSEAMRIKGLAKLVGMRTWGGAVGFETHQHLVDGGTTTPPQFAPFDLNRNWLIEGHGVDPDIEVQNMPGDVVKGKDAQLEAGVAYVLDKIANEPMTLPDTPAYIDRSKNAEAIRSP
ncbi:MAG: PD40 domain-containing protein [Phycisphaerae bacterium]|nr:PD40 domain-containing protein [Phycisphaerae bacterium]